MPPRPLLAIWIALAASVPASAFLSNGLVASLGLLALGAPAPRYWPLWWRKRAFGLMSSALALLLAWMMITAIFAPDPGEAAAKGLRLFALAGLCLAAFAAMDTAPMDTAKRLGPALAAAVLALILLVGCEYISGGLILRQIKDYPKELLLQGRDMTLTQYTQWRVHHALAPSARVLVALGPLAIYALYRRPGGAIAALAAGVIGLALIFILPAALAQVAIVGALLMAAIAWRTPRLALSLLTIGLLTLLMGLPLVALAMNPALPFGIDPSAWEPGLQHRLYMWHFTAERIAERPWFGWGLESARAMPGGAELVALYKAGVAETTVILPLHPHNALLHVWLDGGTLGATALGAAIMGLGQRLNRLRNRRGLFVAIMASTTGLSILMLTDISLWQEWIWALIGLTGAFSLGLARATPHHGS